MVELVIKQCPISIAPSIPTEFSPRKTDTRLEEENCFARAIAPLAVIKFFFSDRYVSDELILEAIEMAT